MVRSVFVQYNGRFDLSDPAAPGPVYTTPRFETGDPRYAWLNKVQAVMKGALLRDLADRVPAVRGPVGAARRPMRLDRSPRDGYAFRLHVQPAELTRQGNPRGPCGPPAPRRAPPQAARAAGDGRGVRGRACRVGAHVRVPRPLPTANRHPVPKSGSGTGSLASTGTSVAAAPDPTSPPGTHWTDATPWTGAPATVLVTHVATDTQGDAVTLAWFRASRTQLALYPGTGNPGQTNASRGPEAVPLTARATLLATFNSGFYEKDDSAGFYAHDTLYHPMVDGQATVVGYANGRVDIIRWTGGEPARTRRHGPPEPVHCSSTRAYRRRPRGSSRTGASPGTAARPCGDRRSASTGMAI